MVAATVTPNGTLVAAAESRHSASTSSAEVLPAGPVRRRTAGVRKAVAKSRSAVAAAAWSPCRSENPYICGNSTRNVCKVTATVSTTRRDHHR
jgi:hypothetical protein